MSGSACLPLQCVIGRGLAPETVHDNVPSASVFYGAHLHGTHSVRMVFSCLAVPWMVWCPAVCCWSESGASNAVRSSVLSAGKCGSVRCRGLRAVERGERAHKAEAPRCQMQCTLVQLSGAVKLVS